MSLDQALLRDRRYGGVAGRPGQLGARSRVPGHRKEIPPERDGRSRDDRLYLVPVPGRCESFFEARPIGTVSIVTQEQRSPGMVSSYRESTDVPPGKVGVGARPRVWLPE